MRAVITRVLSASVSVGGEVVGELPRPGLLVLVGVGHDDDAAAATSLAAKIWGLRILRDEVSASDVDAPILVVSQFTLFASTRKGRRPGWSKAAPWSPSLSWRRWPPSWNAWERPSGAAVSEQTCRSHPSMTAL